MTKIYLEGQEVHGQEVSVSFLKNSQPDGALLDISGEKTQFVFAYVGMAGGETVLNCYKKRPTSLRLTWAGRTSI